MTISDAVIKIADVRPRLRGWQHMGFTPLVLAAGIVLIVLAPHGRAQIGAIAFTASALLLFGVSAVYHGIFYSGRISNIFRRWDHANIFVLIAGTYTPCALILLNGAERIVLLSTIWGVAVVGMALRIFWPKAPRWLVVPFYLAMGWAALFFLPGLLHGAVALGTGIGIAVFVLICVGGALYSVGAVVYGFKKPNPWPKWFGFHEVFHSFTVFAFVAHYTGISIATYALR